MESMALATAVLWGEAQGLLGDGVAAPETPPASALSHLTIF